MSVRARDPAKRNESEPDSGKFWMTTRPKINSVGASKLDRRVAVAPMMDWTDNQILRDRSTGCGVQKSSSPLRRLSFGISGGS